MESKKIEESEEKEMGDKKLPFCTTAPSPEHARAYDDDEPCDDSRAGDSTRD